MKLKSIALFTTVFLTLTACSQKKEKIMSTQNPDITADNIVEKLANEVKHYPKEPMHNINYEQNYCYLEVLVNDIPVYKKFDSPLSASAFDANQAIFKSGTQKVTFRMYPAGKTKDDIDKVFTSFLDLTYVKLAVDVYDNTDKNYKTSPIKEYKTPAIPNPVQGEYPDSIFIATGKNYYEGSFTFEAEVPYQLEGFEKAQDLRKMDRKELETKLLKKYQEVWSIFQNKEYNNIARIFFDKLKYEYISNYFNAEDGEESWKEYMNAFSNPTFEMQPIENYELKFFAEGKLVAFILKTTDPRLRGCTALWGKFKENGITRAFTSNAYFYIPEGETEFKVY